MCDPVVARTNAGAIGGRRIVRGTVLCADHPVVKQRPRLFVPADLAHYCRSDAEQATAAPGEKRAVQPAQQMGDAGLDPEAAAAQASGPKRPPTSGPGSGAPAWREYAATATGTPAEEWAGLGRDEIIALLPDEDV